MHRTVRIVNNIVYLKFAKMVISTVLIIHMQKEMIAEVTDILNYVECGYFTSQCISNHQIVHPK